MSWPYLRYETTSMELINNLAPIFSNATGLNFYTETLSNPKYVAVNRNFPDTEIRWLIQNLINTKKNFFRTFWFITLKCGEYDFTIIDHRKRLLFDVSWNQWKIKWRKFRGGVSEVVMDLLSPYDWTPPLFAFYSMANNDLTDHALDSDSDLILIDAALVTDADLNVIRHNGSALRVSDHPGRAFTGASNNTITWFQGKDNSSISLFCQFRVPDMQAAKELDLIKLENGHILRIFTERNAADKIDLIFEWQESGSAAENLTVTALDVDTWYDICLTFDNINNNYYGYFVESAIGSTWTLTDDFLNGKTVITDGILSDTSPTNFPANVIWKEISLLESSVADIFVVDSPMAHAYLQNVMIIDDYIPALQFNTLRRLCYLWNNKTTFYPK